MYGYTPYPESDEGQDGAEGNEEGQHHDNNGDGGEDGDPGHGNDQYRDGGKDNYQDHQDAGARGTTSSDWVRDPHLQALLVKLPLERNPSWRNWR